MRIVHKVCYLLKRRDAVMSDTDFDSVRCNECPAWEHDQHHGKVKRACRLAAEEFINVVKTGNPGGAKGRAWPEPPSTRSEP